MIRTVAEVVAATALENDAMTADESNGFQQVQFMPVSSFKKGFFDGGTARESREGGEDRSGWRRRRR